MNSKSTWSKILETERPSFRRLFVLFFFGYLPFLIFHITLTLFDIIPVNFNDEQVYGLKGMIILICFSPLVVLLISGLTYLGLGCGYLVLKVMKALSNK